jgi:hypothetical protein
VNLFLEGQSMALLKVADITVDATGQVTGNQGLLALVVHPSATNVQIQPVNTNLEVGYSVTWTYQGQSYEMKFVRHIQHAVACPLGGGKGKN